MSVPKSILRALERRDGHRSAWTGNDVPELVPQHRQGGMGGRPNKDQLSNLIWLESELNGLIESDAAYQAEALQRGIKISGFADPRLIAIDHAVHGSCFLTNDGRATFDPIPEF